MPNMGSDVSYLQTLRSDAADLATAARAAGLDAPVPPCPGLGRGETGAPHRPGVHLVRRGGPRTGPVDFESLQPMPKGDGTIEAFEERAAALADALGGLPEDVPIWNWFGIEPADRRLLPPAHGPGSSAIHRWDAQAGAGTTAPIDTALAVDGMDEFLTLFLASTNDGRSRRFTPPPRHRRRRRMGDPSASGRESSSPRRSTPRPTPPSAAPLRTSICSSGNRMPASALDVVGDAAIVDGWKAAVKF